MAVSSGDAVVIVQGADGLPVGLGPLSAPASGDGVVIVQGADGLPVGVAASAPSSGDPVLITRAADGLPVGVAFGEEGTSCPDGTSPEILLTVTGDFASVPSFDYVEWCGKRWHSDDSGLQQIACPGSYRRTQLYCTGTGGDTGGFWYTEFWTYGGTKRSENSAALWMRRQYRMLDKVGGWERGYIPEGTGCFYDYYGYTTVGQTDACLNVLPELWTTSTTSNLINTSRRDKIRWRGETGTALPIAPTTTVVVNSDLGLITTGQTPWATDWRIPDAWFSSTVYTVGGVDITFTWARGNGW